jgi:hypothetical protein
MVVYQLLISLIIIILLIIYNNLTETFITSSVSTRHTKNMSYDLRGDPCIIHFNGIESPWNMSSYVMAHRPGIPFCNN